jgi:hypothetical protein
MKYGKPRKTAISLLAAAFISTTLAGGILIEDNTAKASDENSAAAYFLSEDRNTQGLWYNGQYGSKDYAEADRNYGVDGCVLFYHWLRVDGQPIKNVEILSDYSNDTTYYKNNERANYNEIPSYIESVTGDSANGYLNYWINGGGTDIEQEWNSVYHHGTLLPVEGGYDIEGNLTHYGQGGYGTESNGSANVYTVITKDTEWHDVTLYVGSNVQHKYTGYDEHTMGIYDLNDKLLAEYVVKDPAQMVYVKFAVKGSYKIRYQSESYASAGYNYGLFFDPHTENENIGVSNFTATLHGAKEVRLEWTNKSDQSITAIYRREKGETRWGYLTEIAAGVNSYTDTTSVVSKTYEYALSSGTIKTAEAYYDQYTKPIQNEHFIQPKVNVKYNNLPDETQIAEVSTAPYRPTRISFENGSYLATADEEFTVRAQLKKSDDDGATFVPYSGVEVTFKFDGEPVYSSLGLDIYPNMNPIMGKAVTDENGYAEIANSLPFAGEYEIIASIELQPDADPMNGYDSTSSRAGLTVSPKPSPNPTCPVITAITDAVKPGDTANITGFNMSDDGELKIAYVKNQGKAAEDFDENRAYNYISAKDIIFTDAVNGTGIMFTFPKAAKAGIYDFYVHNKDGWSKGYTMNAPRPQYLDQEAAYEGQQIQIVGRNFLLSEYGAADRQTALATLKIKLTLIADADGNPASGMSKTLTEKNGGILTGLKETKETALQFESDVLKAEDIPYTDNLRITFVVPSVYIYGTYKVSVASDGKDFRDLSEPTDLKIVEKKAQRWDETVFGTDKSKAVGNDPLGLGVYWAQDLNYTNVVTMTENTFETAKDYTKDLNTTIARVSGEGGGVIYFPEGNYYLYSDVYMESNVMLVGAGQGKTTLWYANADYYNTVWFRGTSKDNVGIARLTLSMLDERLNKGEGWYAPNFVTNWGFKGDYGGDIELADSQNKFLIDVKYDGKIGNLATENTCRQYILICANKNVVWKDCYLSGAQMYTRCDAYTSCYNVYQLWNGCCSSSPPMQGRYTFVENTYIDQNYSGHGLSVRSNTYVAYSYVSHAGSRTSRSNQGEALLAESPGGQFATGKVLRADARSVTLDFMGGKKLTASTLLHYNRFSVYISDGTGVGQYRFVERVGEGAYGNRYVFLDGQKDWDIIPDETSSFYIGSPLNNLTVSHFKAYDTAGTVCLYSQCMDTVVADCKLVDTAGIGVWGIPVDGIKGGRIDAGMNVRIERNDISGVSCHYDVGSNTSQGVGGILLSYSDGGNYAGMIMSNIIIRDNYLHDLLPGVTSYDDHKWTMGTGLAFYSKVTKGQGNPNCARYLVAENNVIEDSEWGIYVDRKATGVYLNNNTVTGTTLNPEGTLIYRPTGFITRNRHEFYVNGQQSDLSGDYAYEDELPSAPADGDKAFFGWTTDENFTSSSPIVSRAFGTNVKLYAVYGYEVVFDYNYKKSDGSEKGEYITVKTLAGGTVNAELEENGDPFRMGDEFEGWYTDKECTQKFDPNSAINSNMRVYAKWASANNGGANGEIKSGKNAGLIIGIVCGTVAAAALAVAGVLIVKKKKR